MMPNSLDRRITAICTEDALSLSLINVTDTARTLERNHLCGPVAGLIQGEFVAAAAILGTLADHPGQTVSLRVAFPEGQLQGASIEVTHEGTIRGYTRKKVLADLDDITLTDKDIFQKALGSTAQCAVVISDRLGGNTNAMFNCNYPDRLTVSDIVEEYYNHSLQRRAIVQISAASEEGHVACVHALLCEFMPEATEEMCQAIEAKFNDGSIQAAIDRGASMDEIAGLLDVTPTKLTTHPIKFACSCSSDKVIAMLKSLPQADRDELIAKGVPTDIYCHMCGRGFTITPEQLKTL